MSIYVFVYFVYNYIGYIIKETNYKICYIAIIIFSILIYSIIDLIIADVH